ncbi:PGPGW domain-containing protein [Lentisalinibacter sediminis]|uniref:PGPGW domain-containing protein n=1 Tax=Lentisalinibacter sediminis TaxID=2992237 RepID=UPI0038668825
MIKNAAKITYKAAKRTVVFVVGVTVAITGVVMLVTPGPAFIVIPLGLAILSIEFAWARRWLRRIRQRISDTASASRSRRAGQRRSAAEAQGGQGDEEKRKQGPEA